MWKSVNGQCARWWYPPHSHKWLHRLKHILQGDVDHYNGITIDLSHLPALISNADFQAMLTTSLAQWQSENRPAVWLKVPIQRAALIPLASKLGFTYHHAENEMATLKLGLNPSRANALPIFATHQLGVAGMVIKMDTREVLVIQEKNRKYSNWKFPGGLADLGEDIGVTAMREVHEETGIVTEFQSILAFRQHHEHPNAFGRSDFYVVCRLKPLTDHIKVCDQEIVQCRWMSIKELQNLETAPITSRLLDLAVYGLDEGFHNVDILCEEMKSVYKGHIFSIFHRKLPKKSGDS